MSSNRIHALTQMLEEDPQNVFCRYSLAMEYAKTGNPESAEQEFARVIAINPDYVAAYFHAGQTFEKAAKPEDARRIYERGLEACGRTGDHHTAAELRGALDLLG